MRPHPPLRALIGVSALLLAAAFGVALAGCGSSSQSTSGGEAVTSGAGTGSGTTPPTPSQTSKAPAGATVKNCSGVRVAGSSCAEGRATAAAWTHNRSCLPAGSGASHSACTIGRYRCIATATGRGLAVNCAQAGRSISFIAPAEEP